MPDTDRVLVAKHLITSRPAPDTKRPTPRRPEHGVITRSCKHMLCDQKIADMPVHSLRQFNVMESDGDSSDGETLHTETESEESDVATQSDLDFIDDSSTDFIDTPSKLHYLSDVEDLRYNSYQTYQDRNTILLKSKHVR